MDQSKMLSLIIRALDDCPDNPWNAIVDDKYVLVVMNGRLTITDVETGESESFSLEET